MLTNRKSKAITRKIKSKIDNHFVDQKESRKLSWKVNTIHRMVNKTAMTEAGVAAVGARNRMSYLAEWQWADRVVKVGR